MAFPSEWLAVRAWLFGTLQIQGLRHFELRPSEENGRGVALAARSSRAWAPCSGRRVKIADFDEPVLLGAVCVFVVRPHVPPECNSSSRCINGVFCRWMRE